MNLDELKKSMSTLDDMLAEKSGDTIYLNTKTCSSAQTRIAGLYWKNILMCSVLATVFIILWLSGADDKSFPIALKGFLGIYMAVAAAIYVFLYRYIKNIKTATSTPMQIMRQVASFRLYSLIAEVFLAIVLAVFFTIFLSNLWNLGSHTFWLVAGALAVSLIVGVMMLPKKIRDFRELTAID